MPILLKSLLKDVNDGYDPLDDPSDRPTPENTWSYTSLECDMTCKVWSIMAIVLIGTHFSFMLGPLTAWAQGSLVLIF